MAGRWHLIPGLLIIALLLGTTSASAAPGDLLASFGADRLNYPHQGVGLAGDGKIYVNDYGNGDLKVYDPSFAFVESWNETHPDREYPQYPMFLNPHALAVHGDRVYVVNAGHDVVPAFTRSGEHLFDITYPGGLNCFWSPSAIATDKDGNVYVTDTETGFVWEVDPRTQVTHKRWCGGQVLVFDPRGRFLRTIGSPGTDPDRAPDPPPDTLVFPTGVFVDAGGTIYVSDYNRVLLYSRDGRWLRTFGGSGAGPGQFNYPTGLAVDGDGRIYVADAFNNRIQVLASSGSPLAAWGGFNVPTGVTLDPAGGRVFVTDMWNHQIQVLEAFPVGAGNGGCRAEFKGFLPPVSIAKPFKVGSTIPVKFAIDTGDCLADSMQVAVVLRQGTREVAGTRVSAAGKMQSLHFNIGTKGFANGNATIVVTLPDGTERTWIVLLD